MLARPLLQLQRTLPPRTISSRIFISTKALQLKCLAVRPSVTSPRLACRPFSVSFAHRNATAIDSTLPPTSTATPSPTSTTKETETTSSDDVYSKVYLGPLESTFRRLKIFSLASLSLSTTLAPFMFVIESNLPINARLALASIAITTSATSTGLVAWCGKPYVTKLKYIRPDENGGAEGIEMMTMSLTLKPRITKVYDPSFLVETRRGFAKWELAQKVIWPKEEGERPVKPGQEETIAETSDKDGNVLGRWVVTWGENGEGTCRELGNVVKYFNVHEELLP